MSVVITTIAPNFNSFAVLLVLGGRIGHCFKIFEVLLDIVTVILAEDTQVCHSVLLPVPFVDFVAGLGGAIDSNATRLPIDPITFKGASVGPDQASVAALGVFVADDRVFLFLWRGALLGSLAFHLASFFVAFFSIDWHKAHLAHKLH